MHQRARRLWLRRVVASYIATAAAACPPPHIAHMMTTPLQDLHSHCCVMTTLAAQHIVHETAYIGAGAQLSQAEAENVRALNVHLTLTDTTLHLLGAGSEVGR
jgi:hypothetical protein